MDIYTKRKLVLLLLVLAGFMCYALPFGRVSFIITLDFNGWEYLFLLFRYSMYNDLLNCAILVSLILLAVEAILILRIDLRFLDSRHKYNDSNEKYIALFPGIGAILLIAWYIGFISSENGAFGRIDFGFYLTTTVYILNTAAVYLSLRRPRQAVGCEMQKRVFLPAHWIAAAAILASLLSYLFPYALLDGFLWSNPRVTGLTTIILTFQDMARAADMLNPNTIFIYLLGNMIFFLIPPFLSIIAGIALWKYHYRLCYSLAFLNGALRILLCVISAIAPAEAQAQFGFGWWLGMISILIGGGAALWITKQAELYN